MSTSWTPSKFVTLALLNVALFSLESFVTSQNINLFFESFSRTDFDDNFRTLADATYSESERSIVLNSQAVAKNISTCARTQFIKKVRFRDRVTGTFASFSTSFTISITAPRSDFLQNGSLPGGGFGFSLNSDEFHQVQSPDNLTLLYQCDARSIMIPWFAVEIDTALSVVYKDVSDNHIGVDESTPVSTQSYNLCGGTVAHCFYFVNGGLFTMWIDYNATKKLFEVRLFNGSFATAPRPAQPLLHIPNFDLYNSTLNDYMNSTLNDYFYIGFNSRTSQNPVAHHILSWNFSSTGLVDVSSLTKSIGRMFGIFGCIAAVVIGLVILILTHKRRIFRRSKNFAPDLSHLSGPRLFSQRELSKATKNFRESELIGTGGYSDVFKGTLQPSGTVIAVKRCRYISILSEEAFVAEASSVYQIRHRNLLQMVGWCHESRQMLLVYEYMSNGSLDEWLFQTRRRQDGVMCYQHEVLSLTKRHTILRGVAAALEYLHEDWLQCVLHRDIKSCNVMLDANFNARLGDFGLARIIEHDKLEKTTLMAGTFGYIAPEMLYSGKATKEADVYSFGILLLTVVCGRRPNEITGPEFECTVLLDCVWEAYEADKILTMVDPRLEITKDHILSASNSVDGKESIRIFLESSTSGDELEYFEAVNVIKSLLHLGLLCCHSDPSARPTMRVVNQILQSAYEDLSMAKMPPLPSTRPQGPYTFLRFSESDVQRLCPSSSSTTEG